MSSIGSSYNAGSAGADPFEKPLAPELAEIQADLDALRGALQASQGQDGTVDVAALEQRIAATGDPELEAQLSEIKSEFRRGTEVTFASSCGGTQTRTQYESPKTLTRDEVQRALSDIAAARSQAEVSDANADGHITPKEIRDGLSASNATDLAQDLLRASTKGYEAELRGWIGAVSGVMQSVDQRKSIDGRIEAAAGFHAKTPEGQAALIAGYRDLLTRGEDFPKSSDALDAELWGAERGLAKFLKNVPIFGKIVSEGHLSDREIKKFLGTDDLKAFTAERNKDIEGRLGGPYEDVFLGGKDLKGHEHLADPDFKASRYASGCS